MYEEADDACQQTQNASGIIPIDDIGEDDL